MPMWLSNLVVLLCFVRFGYLVVHPCLVWSLNSALRAVQVLAQARFERSEDQHAHVRTACTLMGS